MSVHDIDQRHGHVHDKKQADGLPVLLIATFSDRMNYKRKALLQNTIQ